VNKAVLCTALAILQVLICTLGQGAFTLCVRKDGTQKVYWSFGFVCQTEEPQTKCPCRCCEDDPACPDEIPSGQRLIGSCSVCTDYLLVADQPTVTVEKQEKQEALQAVAFTSVSFEQFAFDTEVLVLAKLAEVQATFGCATGLSTVVLRC
jgi:hypothetical protein